MSSAATVVRELVTVAFEVEGVPRPQGRKTAITRGRRTVVVESGRALLRPWQEAIAGEAARACSRPLEGPIVLDLGFLMPRPKTHFRTGAHADELRLDAPIAHAHRPDLDKLARAVLDALTGIAYLDDGQVAELAARKVYGAPAGVRVVVTRPAVAA